MLRQITVGAGSWWCRMLSGRLSLDGAICLTDHDGNQDGLVSALAQYSRSGGVALILMLMVGGFRARRVAPTDAMVSTGQNVMAVDGDQI